MAPRLDESMQMLDPTAQQMIIAAANGWTMERYQTEPDQIRLLSSDTTAQGVAFDIEVSAAGVLDQLHVISQSNGQVDVRLPGDERIT